MFFEGREWEGAPGAAPSILKMLRATMPVELPQSFYSFLEYSNGGEGPLPVHPYNVIMLSAEDVIKYFQENIPDQNDYPGYILLGLTGSGSRLVFDTRDAPPYQIVASDFIADQGWSQMVAPDFDAFLDLIGYQDPEEANP